MFVPADVDSDQFDVQLMDRPPKDWSGVGKTVLLGLLVGLMLVASMFLLRDGIVANVPGLAPLMPPKAAPAPRFPARQPVLAFDTELASRVAAIFMACVRSAILVVGPLAVPAFLSRFRILSVGRWLILAAVSGFFTFVGFSGNLWFSVVSMASPKIDDRAFGAVIASTSSYVFVFSFFGIAGCLIGAAVHPKD